MAIPNLNLGLSQSVSASEPLPWTRGGSTTGWMHFAWLPADHVLEICSHLAAVDVARLWLCGDSTLNARLSAGGVRKFDVNLEELNAIVWPRFLPCFTKLVHFRISSEYQTLIRLFSGVIWLDLPQTLVEIEVSIGGAFNPLISSVVEHRGLFPLLKRLKVASFNSQKVNSELNFGAWFPSLEKLELLSNPYRTLPDLDINLLPRGLTWLKASCNHLQSSDDTFGWPESLLYISLSITKGHHWFEKVPSALQSLTIGHHFQSEQASLIRLEELPRGLKELTIEVFSHLDMAKLKGLPQRLETLHLDCTYDNSSSYQGQPSEALIKSLPESLTSLSAFFILHSPEEASALPRGLKSLFRMSQIPTHIVPFLPPLLSHLSLPANSPWSEEVITALNPELVRLEVQKPCLENMLIISRLLKLKTLIVHGSSYLPFLMNLPVALETLILPIEGGVTSEEVLVHLPRSLTYLHSQYGSPASKIFAITSRSLGKLPANLKTLALGKLELTEESSGWLGALPTSLTSLDLRIDGLCGSHMFEGLSSIPLRWLRLILVGRPSDAIHLFFPHMPKSLRSLDISSIWNLPETLEDHHLFPLPRALTTLAVPSPTKFSDRAQTLFPLLSSEGIQTRL